MLKVAYLQGHNVIGKKRQSPIGCYSTPQENAESLHIFPLELGAPKFSWDRKYGYGKFSGVGENKEILSDNGELIKNKQ